MFFIHGWRKQAQPPRHVFDSYCYVCQRDSAWHLLRESEWITFFGFNTIPLLSKEALVCGRCADAMALQKVQARALLRGDGVAAMIDQLEAHQLAAKTEVQRNFLRAARGARGRRP